MKLRKLAGAMAIGMAAVFGSMTAAQAADTDTIKIGYITDLSGLYADIDGQGGLEAIRMARCSVSRSSCCMPITRTSRISPHRVPANGSIATA